MHLQLPGQNTAGCFSGSVTGAPSLILLRRPFKKKERTAKHSFSLILDAIYYFSLFLPLVSNVILPTLQVVKPVPWLMAYIYLNEQVPPQLIPSIFLTMMTLNISRSINKIQPKKKKKNKKVVISNIWRAIFRELITEPLEGRQRPSFSHVKSSAY